MSQELDSIRKFVAEVERRAEERMLKSHKLEGMHYASMKELLAEMEQAERSDSSAVISPLDPERRR